jgi:hypothetical protein
MPAPRDTNILVASLLRDLASVQKSTQSKWGYKRAAQAILNLDEPIEQLRQPDGTLRRIPNVGPSSLRGADLAKSRALRANFLSRAQVVAALGKPSTA